MEIKVAPSPKIISHQRKWFGLKPANLYFLNTNEEVRLSYAAITQYYKLIMTAEPNSEGFEYKTARSLIKDARGLVERAEKDWKKAQRSKNSFERVNVLSGLQADLASVRRKFYNLLKWRNNRIENKCSRIVLPAELQLIYTLDEINDFGQRLMNRLNSSYLYEDSEDKALLECVLETVLPRIWTKYVSNYQMTDSAESQGSIMTEIFEYIMIVIYRLNGKSSLTYFSELPSESVVAMIEDFEKYTACGDSTY